MADLIEWRGLTELRLERGFRATWRLVRGLATQVGAAEAAGLGVGERLGVAEELEELGALLGAVGGRVVLEDGQVVELDAGGGGRELQRVGGRRAGRLVGRRGLRHQGGVGN